MGDAVIIIQLNGLLLNLEIVKDLLAINEEKTQTYHISKDVDIPLTIHTIKTFIKGVQYIDVNVNDNNDKYKYEFCCILLYMAREWIKYYVKTNQTAIGIIQQSIDNLLLQLLLEYKEPTSPSVATIKIIKLMCTKGLEL